MLPDLNKMMMMMIMYCTVEEAGGCEQLVESYCALCPLS